MSLDDPASAPEGLMKPVTDYRDSLNDSSEEEVPLKNIVKAKRAQSLDSPRKGENKNKFNITTSKVHEQQEATKAATESLTLIEKDRIQCRQDAVDAQQKEKAKKVKGKTTDPREWGSLDLDENEIDPETQEAIFKNFEAQKYDCDCDHASKKEKLRRKIPNKQF